MTSATEAMAHKVNKMKLGSGNDIIIAPAQPAYVRQHN
jgi:hypothetical protein